MRRPASLSWIWLWLIILLLGVLATLQWRWTGEVSRAEKTRMEEALDEAATHFAADVDLEISRLFSWFQGRESELATQLSTWRDEAPYPEILLDVLVPRRHAAGARLEQWDEELGELRSIDWLDELEPLRQLLSDPTQRRRRSRPPGLGLGSGAAPGIGPPIDGVPSILIPGRPFLVLRLDLEALVRLLTDLAAHHFPSDSLDYDLAIFGRNSVAPLFMTNSELDTDGLLENGPLTSFFSVRRFEDLPWSGRSRFFTRFGRGRMREVLGFGGGARTERRPPSPLGTWLLYARHRQGSLEAAVSRLRLRNLAVSLGILLVLSMSGAFLILSNRRAQALARQQLDFVAGLTHELHTPLAAIESASANLADGVIEEPARVRDYGQLIQREGRRLTELVGQALELAGVRSGYQSLEAVPIEIEPLVEGVIAANQWQIDQEGTAVKLDLAPGLPPLLGDEAALRRVLGNLLNNAIKYGEGEVTISARVAKTPPSDTTGREDSERRVKIEVIDNGPGISWRDLPHLFEPFYRGQRAREGTTPGSGLGLHLAKELVEGQGGKITVHLDNGVGTTFQVEMPASEEGNRGQKMT